MIRKSSKLAASARHLLKGAGRWRFRPSLPTFFAALFIYALLRFTPAIDRSFSSKDSSDVHEIELGPDEEQRHSGTVARRTLGVHKESEAISDEASDLWNHTLVDCDNPDVLALAWGSVAERMQTVCMAQAVAAMLRARACVMWLRHDGMEHVRPRDLFRAGLNLVHDPQAKLDQQQQEKRQHGQQEQREAHGQQETGRAGVEEERRAGGSGSSMREVRGRRGCLRTGGGGQGNGSECIVLSRPVTGDGRRRLAADREGPKRRLVSRQVEFGVCPGEAADSEHPLVVDLFLSPLLVPMAAQLGKGGCILREEMDRCFAALEPAEGVQLLLEHPRNSLARVRRTTAVFIEDVSAGRCAGCTPDPENNMTAAHCALRRLAYAYLRDPSADFTVAADDPDAAKWVADVFDPRRAPFLPGSARFLSGFCSPDRHSSLSSAQPEPPSTAAQGSGGGRPTLLSAVAARAAASLGNSLIGAVGVAGWRTKAALPFHWWRRRSPRAGGESKAVPSSPTAEAGSGGTPMGDSKDHLMPLPMCQRLCAQHQLALLRLLSHARGGLISLRPSPSSRIIAALGQTRSPTPRLSSALTQPHGPDGPHSEGRSSAPASSPFVVHHSICASPRLLPITRQRFAKFFVVEEKLGLAYCAVPKVASTGWKMWLRAMLNLSEPTNQYLAHSYKGSGLGDLSRCFTEEAAVRLMTKPDMFKFVFVRNPFARISSTFLNKLVITDAPDRVQGWGTRQFWSQEFFRDLWPLFSVVADPKTHLPSFPNFLCLIREMQRRGLELERHLAPQVELCGLEAIKYDFVGHFESLRRDVRHVTARFGHRQLSLFREGVKVHPTHSDRKLAQLYTLDAYKTVLQVYGSDLNVSLNGISYSAPQVLRDSLGIEPREPRPRTRSLGGFVFEDEPLCNWS